MEQTWRCDKLIVAASLILPSSLLYPVWPSVLLMGLQDMTVPYEVIGIVYMLCPEWLEVLIANLQPWLTLSIVMDHGSLADAVKVRLFLITQA